MEEQEEGGRSKKGGKEEEKKVSPGRGRRNPTLSVHI